MCGSIRLITEAGLVQHWLTEEIGSVPQCLRPPSADRSDGIAPLNFEAFTGPLLVLVGGEGIKDEVTSFYNILILALMFYEGQNQRSS